MEHLLENIGFIQDGTILPGFIFGVIHVSLVILGFYTGWSINRLLKNVTKGYIAGILGNHSNVRVNSSTLADTISFQIPPAEDIIRICKEHNFNVPALASAYIDEEFHTRTIPNERYLIRYMMKMEDLCTI